MIYVPDQSSLKWDGKSPPLYELQTENLWRCCCLHWVWHRGEFPIKPVQRGVSKQHIPIQTTALLIGPKVFP